MHSYVGVHMSTHVCISVVVSIFLSCVHFVGIQMETACGLGAPKARVASRAPFSCQAPTTRVDTKSETNQIALAQHRKPTTLILVVCPRHGFDVPSLQKCQLVCAVLQPGKLHRCLTPFLQRRSDDTFSFSSPLLSCSSLCFRLYPPRMSLSSSSSF
ncbi:putative transmembrane protein [Toxoplasma gondii RUB]|uniref:Putative transmembrane protein n=4 Tax=Toxoplasma gondii TaxID=5811 RepID=B9Q881_TOXGV|nr:putative transmembrane protein [Toxoplasma gondii VEG]KFG42371.1 putative transmembrane protein [Toxoplasma gondii p89]KFG61005.1 putative transmembrane protein [Toxoplasma gondii RUB]KFH09970.1 putative transmembrane protein [Toxoplasma gondii MAS]CEL76417.1 TPA: hypothetical protein BN1205_068220 [Toxoplasma gondii VEG]